VVMPETRLEDAQRIAERLRRQVAGEPFRNVASGEPLDVTISIGVASTLAGETKPDGLLKRADRAMYEAKAAGRNRVIAKAA